MKRYYLHYEWWRDTSGTRGPGVPLPDHDEFYGKSNSLAVCKRYIKEVRKYRPDAHNFRIYDSWIDHPYQNPVYVEE